jgi:hypothetical protein
MTIQQYIEKINTLYKTGNAREHSYRQDLLQLLPEATTRFKIFL